jgi:putative transposase
VDRNHPKLSVATQCRLLGIPRSTLYYKRRPEKPENIELMSIVDEIYTKSPYMGSRKIARKIRRDHKKPVNRKRITRIMQFLGISAIYPKPRTSISNVAHKKYPYLMSAASITGPNQAWCTDITYVRLEGGFAYLVAIMDWYSRRVLSWRLSNTMDTSFCLEALREAMKDAKPEIFNSDQGSQFTSIDFTDELLNQGITISMDGRGRFYDNIFIERLWRSVKYENIYPKGYRTLAEARAGLKTYFDEYNGDRPHQSLDYRTPEEVHFATAA